MPKAAATETAPTPSETETQPAGPTEGETETATPVEIESQPAAQTTPSGMSAITGAVIGAAGKAGTGGLLAMIIIIGGLMVYSYYGGMPGSSNFSRAANFHKRAENAHRKGNQEKAEKLYQKAQKLRERGEKQAK